MNTSLARIGNRTRQSSKATEQREAKDMKLGFPVGAKVGSIVVAAWDIAACCQSGINDLLPGDFEGRVVEIDGSRITVHFVYAPKDETNVPEETLVIDLNTGLMRSTAA